MILLIEELATMLGLPLYDKHGRRIYGKHSWRAAGAVYLTKIGLHVYKIQLLPRWASPLITHYARLAPLKSLATDMKKALAKKDEKSSRDKMEAATMRKVRESVDEHMAKVRVEVERLEQMIKRGRGETQPHKVLE